MAASAIPRRNLAASAAVILSRRTNSAKRPRHTGTFSSIEHGDERQFLRRGLHRQCTCRVGIACPERNCSKRGAGQRNHTEVDPKFFVEFGDLRGHQVRLEGGDPSDSYCTTGGWGWRTLFFLGAYHGINPGMGWLFAVALGMQDNSARAVYRSLIPITAGHALAIGAVILLAGVVQIVLPLNYVKIAVLERTWHWAHIGSCAAGIPGGVE